MLRIRLHFGICLSALSSVAVPSQVAPSIVLVVRVSRSLLGDCWRRDCLGLEGNYSSSCPVCPALVTF